VKRSMSLALGIAALLIGVGIGFACGPTGWAWPSPELFSLRLMRVLLAVVVGAGLSVAGAALQSLWRNPLADPFVLGVSGGAAMGAAFVVGLGAMGGLSVGSIAGVVGIGASTAGAVIGAVAASAVLVAWAPKVAGDDHAGGAALIGVVVNAFSWAIVSVVRALLPAQDAAGLGQWLIGALQHPALETLGLVAFATVGGGLVLVGQGASLTLLQGGEDDAARLGVHVTRVRLVVVVAASIVVGAAVASTGVIGFVGLLVPHAVRRLGAGGDDRLVLPLSALTGGGLLAALDGLARAAFALVGSELPVGALCALMGAPALAVLLVRDAKRSRS
jgi:iron complex transport system permease protein